MSTEPSKHRRANANDWPAVRDLLAANHLPLQGEQEHLNDFLLIEDSGGLLGCIGFERYGESALLRSCAVNEQHRSMGTGAALTNALIEHTRRAGINRLVLLTTTAEHYFSRFGFVCIPRNQAPVAVQSSVEFRGACPASATVMRLEL